uniref:HD domain-containing protein n=1 Tax=Candidatus Cryptobacteroides bacterium TaxID=3085639 RepID=UPI004028473D
MQTLKEYIESEIIPRYDNFDGAHKRDHVRSVIRQSQELSKYYDVNPEILYAAAAYHDLGLCEGREKHHLVSGRIIREDKTLLNWFSVEEIEVIAEAAEDHRASNETPPRSIYGKIIAESDRLIDPETVIRRTVQYGFAHYPQMNREQMWERTLTHLQKKYGYGGYLKLWIPESSNACRLEELRKIIADEKRLRSMFDRFYDEE